MDYEFKTTFWSDFTIADAFGKEAVLDTYNRAFKEWKKDTIYLTELVLVLNWKSWQLFENDEELARLYADLYYKTDDYALSTLKDNNLSYYLQTID